MRLRQLFNYSGNRSPAPSYPCTSPPNRIAARAPLPQIRFPPKKQGDLVKVALFGSIIPTGGGLWQPPVVMPVLSAPAYGHGIGTTAFEPAFGGELWTVPICTLQLPVSRSFLTFTSYQFMNCHAP